MCINYTCKQKIIHVVSVPAHSRDNLIIFGTNRMYIVHIVLLVRLSCVLVCLCACLQDGDLSLGIIRIIFCVKICWHGHAYGKPILALARTHAAILISSLLIFGNMTFDIYVS